MHRHLRMIKFYKGLIKDMEGYDEYVAFVAFKLDRELQVIRKLNKL